MLGPGSGAAAEGLSLPPLEAGFFSTVSGHRSGTPLRLGSSGFRPLGPPVWTAVPVASRWWTLDLECG